MGNPNPSRVTDELWYFWESFKAFEPSVRLGGIYALKPGYHNTRAGNSPSNYSVLLPDDKLGPHDKSAAIDLTFPDAQAGDYTTIKKYSGRLLESGRALYDPRGNVLREFYGNADGGSDVEGWDFQSVRSASSDSSHLWHIHLSFLRRYVTSRSAMDDVLSILKGEPVAIWKINKSRKDKDMTPAQFAAILKDPEVAALLRGLAWQYTGGGIPAGKSVLAVLNDINTNTSRPLDYSLLADEIVAKLVLPVGQSLSVEDVKAAVKAALREGVVN